MKIRIAAFAVFLFGASSVLAQALQRYEYSAPKMGTTFRLVFYTTDSMHAVELKDSAFLLVDRFNSIFSDYDPDSEVSRLSASAGSGEFVEVSSLLSLMINRSLHFPAITDQTFDITIGPLTKLWRRAFRRNEMPVHEQIMQAKALVGSDLIEIKDRKHVKLKKKGMRLDFGAVAKGYTVDAIFQKFQKEGVTRMLIDGGGDLRIGDPPPGEKGWLIDMPDGSQVSLANKGLATSGDRYKHIEYNGKRYSHIVDPRTGYGVLDAPTVVVIGADCWHADIAASAYSILGKEALGDFLDSTALFEFEFFEF